MKSLTFVEIDVDRCQLVYGESPCTAAIGVTGNRKCYNTRATCQDPANYDPEPETVRFSVASDHLFESGIDSIPSVVSVTHNPARIRIAEDLGERASVSIVFQDHPDSDITQDPYISERPDPAGTYWGRFRARHKFLLGRPLRWVEGYVGQTLGQMTTRHYIIESVAGPDLSGSVTITAKDPLKLADGERARVPSLSIGELAAAITETDTSATLSPAGVGDAEYPASGKVAIGKEVISFTRSGDTLTLTRAQSGTDAEDHDAGDRVQLVKIYTAQTAAFILNDLLTQGASIPPALIDIADWNSRDKGRQFSAEIAEPEPVRKLVGELMQQAGVTLWFDEINNTIRYRSIEDLAAPSDSVDDDIFLADSYSERDQPEKRVSQAWIYYGKVNPLEREDDPQNYRLSVLEVNLASESDDQWGRAAIRQVFSRWIPAGAGAVAIELARTIVSRFVNPPRKFQLALQADTKPALNMGTTFLLSSPTLQDDTGAIKPATVSVLARRDSWRSHELECEEQLFDPFDPDAPLEIPIESDANNINLRTVFDESGLGIEPDADTKVTFVIRDGIVIGSVDSALPSLDVGDWPTGADVALRVRPTAFVAGRGGRGGDGGRRVLVTTPGIPPFFVLLEPAPGLVGGTAIFTRFPISVENEGTIAGGGGGGGGGGGAGSTTAFAGGGGGGGGGGSNSTGGTGGLGDDSGEDGLPGSLTDGGAGGSGGTVSSNQGGTGGAGGAPAQAGLVGADAAGFNPQTGAAGGAPGNAIDGDSFITFIVEGSILGARVN